MKKFAIALVFLAVIVFDLMLTGFCFVVSFALVGGILLAGYVMDHFASQDHSDITDETSLDLGADCAC